MENYITLINEESEEEILAEILFTFENNEDNFVLLTIVNEIGEDEDVDVLAYKYEPIEDDQIGNLIEIPDNSSDWEVVEEMLELFQSSKFENAEE